MPQYYQRKHNNFASSIYASVATGMQKIQTFEEMTDNFQLSMESRLPQGGLPYGPAPAQAKIPYSGRSPVAWNSL